MDSKAWAATVDVPVMIPQLACISACAPMTNAERQRNFRARHPGYHKRYYKTAAQWRAEREAQRQHLEAERVAGDPQLLLFPGERPTLAA